MLPIKIAELDYAKAQSENVYINVTVTNELYYEIIPSVSVNEVGLPISFTIIVTDQNGNPVEGMDIILNLSSGSTNFNTTPLTTNSSGQVVTNYTVQISGVYDLEVEVAGGNLNLTAQDSPYEVQWLDLSIPIVTPLPEYSNQSPALFLWSYSGFAPIETYEFYVEVAADSDFSSIVANSGWQQSLSYDFSSLPDGQQYFFRVKSRNSGGAESGWSAVEATIYDATPPEIVVEGIEIEETEEGFNVLVTVQITDNVGVETQSLSCVSDEEQQYTCATLSGQIFTIDSEKLETQLSGQFYDSYKFCLLAIDLAGNSNEVCNLSFEIETKMKKKQGLVTTVINTIGNTFKNAVEFVGEGLENMTQEQLQTASVAASGGALVVSMWFFSFEIARLPYIFFQFLTNIMSILGLRVKGKPYGFVYDSVTKEPLAHCIVRIYDAVTGKLVRTDVTDVYGTFTSRLEEGSYKIVVNCADYIFPTKVVIGRTDFPWDNVYHGETVTLDKESEPNIAVPLDPRNPKESKYYKALLKSRFAVVMKVLLSIIMFIGFWVSIYLFRRYPNILNFVVVLLYMLTFITGIKTFLDNPLKFGAVKSILGKTEPNVQIGLKELEFDRIVTKRVTDDRGLYRFVVPPGKYKLELLEEGYELAADEDKYIFESKSNKRQSSPLIIAKDVFIKGSGDTDLGGVDAKLE